MKVSEYGNKSYNDMIPEERDVVEQFEGKKVMRKNLGQRLFENLMPSIPLLMTA